MTHLTSLPPFVASYGYGRRLFYRTEVIEAASGRYERNSRWSYPKHRFTLPLRNRTQVQLEQVATYFHACAGAGHTFNFLDLSEDRTCALADTPAQNDVTLGTATAAQTDFQLIKTYTSGGRTQSRKITRPIETTILVEKDGVLQTLITDYTVESLGVIRFTSGLSGGEIIKAGFRFYVPVAFERDDIGIVITDYGSEYIGDSAVDLIEERE